MADVTEVRALLGGGCLEPTPTPCPLGGLWLFFSCRKMEVKANTSISNAWTVQLASVTWFIFSSCEQAVSLQRETDRGRRGRMESVVGEGGGMALKGKKSNHSSIWMIWNASVLYQRGQTMKSKCSSRREPSVRALHIRQEMKRPWNFYVIIKIFTERLPVIARGSSGPDLVFVLLYIFARPEWEFLACVL